MSAGQGRGPSVRHRDVQAWSQKKRTYRLQFVEPTCADFLTLARQFARSTEAGPVGSQYEERLWRGDLSGEPELGLLGVGVESELLCALSYGYHVLPRNHEVSARIDLVITRARNRGRGLAALVMAEFLHRSIVRFAGRLAHLSVVAQHPAIETFVRRIGYTPLPNMSAHIFELHLRDDEARSALDRRLRALVTARLDVLAELRDQWWTEASSDSGGKAA